MHGLLLLCTVLTTQRTAVPPVSGPHLVELTPESLLQALPKSKEAEKKKEIEKFRRQIVQTSPGREVKEAVTDAFLGEKNQVVDRQTVGSKMTTVMGKGAQKPRPKVKDVKDLTNEQSQQNSPVVGNLGIPILQRLREKNEVMRALQPDWADPGQLPQDYVRGLQQGEQTALNTREFVFFGYYQRIRDRLDRAWVPILREKLVRHYRSGRQLASDMDYVTKVVVILNLHGEIVRVQLIGESGTRDLDEAAIKAFNRAGPFPNPPRGIVDANGEIQIPWEFILKT
ncbi:MAG: TonB C-terminal domain-containing protein [Oligoflexia bacterium]|nr:TonB C-terminal domain-containing protein [Oligoflexia bacterium]